MQMKLDTRDRIVIPEKEASIQDIVNLVNFKFIDGSRDKPGFQDMIYERIVVQGPSGSDPNGFLFVGLRETTFFLTDTECKLPSYRSLAQIIESATMRPNYDLAKMRLVVPYGFPGELTIHADE